MKKAKKYAEYTTLEGRIEGHPEGPRSYYDLYFFTFSWGKTR